MNVLAGRRLVLYAPNAHIGGSLVLLQGLLQGWYADPPLLAYLDQRAKNKLLLKKNIEVNWVKPTLWSRFCAEISLKKTVGASDIILCLHNFLPLFSNTATNVVFFHHSLLIDRSSLRNFDAHTRLRLSIERVLLICLGRKRKATYVVQTDSMRRALNLWITRTGRTPDVWSILIIPFNPENKVISCRVNNKFKWDFIYVAHGHWHKNHHNLIAAWSLLADSGIFPSLALTLNENDRRLWDKINDVAVRKNLAICNLGSRPQTELIQSYGMARALIYPSFSESFGLPLIEASCQNLPIVASELDFVRDVCMPVETFDPHSPVSIARAVRRFLQDAEAIVPVETPAVFWKTMLQNVT
ncbi:MAG: glycosyltransferase [Pseudomonadota bacterium]